MEKFFTFLTSVVPLFLVHFSQKSQSVELERFKVVLIQYVAKRGTAVAVVVHHRKGRYHDRGITNGNEVH